jgi:hypothetical protein
MSSRSQLCINPAVNGPERGRDDIDRFTHVRPCVVSTCLRAAGCCAPTSGHALSTFLRAAGFAPCLQRCVLFTCGRLCPLFTALCPVYVRPVVPPCFALYPVDVRPVVPLVYSACRSRTAPWVRERVASGNSGPMLVAQIRGSSLSICLQSQEM